MGRGSKWRPLGSVGGMSMKLSRLFKTGSAEGALVPGMVCLKVFGLWSSGNSTWYHILAPVPLLLLLILFLWNRIYYFIQITSLKCENKLAKYYTFNDITQVVLLVTQVYQQNVYRKRCQRIVKALQDVDSALRHLSTRTISYYRFYPFPLTLLSLCLVAYKYILFGRNFDGYAFKIHVLELALFHLIQANFFCLVYVVRCELRVLRQTLMEATSHHRHDAVIRLHSVLALYDRLLDVLQDISSIHSPQLLLFVLIITFEVVFNAVEIVLPGGASIFVLLSFYCIISNLFVLFRECETTHNEVARINETFWKLAIKRKNQTFRSKLRVVATTPRIVQLNAGGFFNMKYTTLITFFNSVTTYLAIIFPKEF